MAGEDIPELWFDVGIEEYTTEHHRAHTQNKLWFDVGIEEYTTSWICFLTSA